MLHVHSSSTARACVDGMGPCNKVQHCHIGVCITSVLQELGWEDLKSRRDQNKATMMYRIVNNLVEIPVGQSSDLNATGLPTRGQQQRFLPIHCSINAYKGPFFPSGMIYLPVRILLSIWNGLPSSVISAPTLEDFKLLVGAGIPRP